MTCIECGRGILTLTRATDRAPRAERNCDADTYTAATHRIGLGGASLHASMRAQRLLARVLGERGARELCRQRRHHQR